MKLSKYKKFFEEEFHNDIGLPEDYFLLIKRNKKDYKYELTDEQFYGLQPPFTYKNHKGQLVVKVQKNTNKKLYLVYLTKDLKFDVVPDKSFVDLEFSRRFYLNIDIETNKSLTVTPYIVPYNKIGKKKMEKITRPMQFFEVDEDVIKLRLVFKVSGHGNFIIRSITRRDTDVS